MCIIDFFIESNSPSFQWSQSLGGIFGETNQSELAAFISYALAFPKNFLALVDTYDVSKNSDSFAQIFVDAYIVLSRKTGLYACSFGFFMAYSLCVE